MEYIKRFFARAFKFRFTGLKTFNRLVLFQSDDELRKRYRQERNHSFFIDYNMLTTQYKHLQ